MEQKEYDIARNLDAHGENLEKFLATGGKKGGDCDACVYLTCKTNVTPYGACCDIQKGVFDLITTFYCDDQDDDEEMTTSLDIPGENPPIQGEKLANRKAKSEKDIARYKEEYPKGLFGERVKDE